MPFIPFVSGVSYEIIKLTAKNNHFLFHILKTPGIWLQNITTKEPDDKMIEVSISAIKNAFGDELVNYQGKKYTAEAIG